METNENKEKEKVYYWIKLKTNFFNREDIDFLLSQKNGAEYVVLYQMLCLNTANNEGRLESKIGEMLVPYNADKIVRDCKYFDIDTVNIAMALYKRLGLIYEEVKDGVLKISNYEEMVGYETKWASQKRLYREKQKALNCNKDNKDNVEDNLQDNVRQEYRDKSIEIRDKNIDIRNKSIEDNNTSSLPTISKSNDKDFIQEFNDLWEHYPNKKGKDQAMSKYILARKNGTTYDEVANGLKNYIDYCIKEKLEEKFIKHGSTWFNQKCWKDVYTTNKNNNQKVDKQMEILKGVHNGNFKVG